MEIRERGRVERNMEESSSKKRVEKRATWCTEVKFSFVDLTF
jgi:hypothetical protein